jgi:hypothetical protein
MAVEVRERPAVVTPRDADLVHVCSTSILRDSGHMCEAGGHACRSFCGVGLVSDRLVGSNHGLQECVVCVDMERGALYGQG